MSATAFVSAFEDEEKEGGGGPGRGDSDRPPPDSERVPPTIRWRCCSWWRTEGREENENEEEEELGLCDGLSQPPSLSPAK
mmetsp:Transcript_15052/g.36861  ORF Transcript_15052/g.36861 Transcript_15052/m.36861 type:complete len:81 (+) Transcript_15052:368-610(+)